MSKQIIVILVKTSWCGHCNNFKPIFNEATENYKLPEDLKDYKVQFKCYDMETVNDKNNLTVEHNGALNMINGYPTVLICTYDNDNRNKKYYQIDHTVVNDDIENDSEKIKDASDRFLSNIYNSIKSINSEGKILYMQAGGNGFKTVSKYQSSMTESIYRNKYLKYKAKYTELKNSI